MIRRPALRVAVAQINSRVGDVVGNMGKIAQAVQWAQDQKADILVTPELGLCGYPPDDLLLRDEFIEAQRAALGKLAALTGDCAVVVGLAMRAPRDMVDVDARPRSLYNTAAVLQNGQIVGYEVKRRLPTYGVFAEARFFQRGERSHQTFTVAGVPTAIVICEDVFDAQCVQDRLEAGAQFLVSINASPWHLGKQQQRLSAVRDHSPIPSIYVNMVGGQDGLVFDGSSFFMAGDQVLWQAPAFEEGSWVLDTTDLEPTHRFGTYPSDNEEHGQIWSALRLGVRDYVDKSGAIRVWIGLSGGIDSAVTAALAVDALGPERVAGVLMPSEFSSAGSVADAQDLADRLGIRAIVLPIAGAHAAMERILRGSNDGTDQDAHPISGRAFSVMDENLQARIRASLLLALSNANGGIVLTTGNKSEMAMGYYTLFGDSAGGFDALGDVYKTQVYSLARWRNARAVADGESQPIPARSIDKPPSAELRPDQQDTDSLPPYEVLDFVLQRYVDDDLDPVRIISMASMRFHMGEEQTRELVERIRRAVDACEYKRRQSPPCVKVSSKAWGPDRRLPISLNYRIGV